MARWLRRSGSLVFAAFLACGTSNADGEPCSTNDDCESGVCSLSGKCGRGECQCEGDECGHIQSSCPEGAVCWQSSDPLQRDYRVCRFACDADRKCPAGQHCEDGTCAPGPEPLALTWEAAPQSCTVRSPCTFRVRPPDGVVIDTCSWSVREQGKDATPETTKVPELVHTFSRSGIYEVTVDVRATNGANGRLTASTSVCVGVGGSCASGAPCCSGTCTSDGTCR
jgi:hypothetical protein